MKVNDDRIGLRTTTGDRLIGAMVLTVASALFGVLSADGAEDADRPISADKTLVAWASLANLDQQGGSALTIQSGPQFDAIVFGERAHGKWMAGSDNFRRTQKDQDANAAETAASDALIQMAGTGTPLARSIEDARIYGRALSVQEIRALKPNEASDVKPLAWWDFEGETTKDRAGHFAHHEILGGTKVEGGRLVLDGKGYLIAAQSEADAKQATLNAPPPPPTGPYVPETPTWPDEPPADWVTFHLAHPGPGPAMPGDPNCIFDYQGRVHPHYIYRNAWGFVFGHVSSDDMVRWQWHKTVLAPPTTGHGMFSGTGFSTRDGQPAIIYHGQGAGRNVIQHPTDDSFDSWTEPVPVVPKNADGTTPDIRHWDPDCWLMNDTYYAYSGGQNPQLMKSTDLRNWTYLGDLLHPDYPADLGIPKDEDISCGNMFQIGNKWMLLCISHPKGARYYLGDFKDEKYLPDFRASWSCRPTECCESGRCANWPSCVTTASAARTSWSRTAPRWRSTRRRAMRWSSR